jgi:hypothetical protein
MTKGKNIRFFTNVAKGDNLIASPKHPQSSTGIHVALKNVRIVKNVIDTNAKIDTRRMRTLNSNIKPIIISAPHSHIEKGIAAGENHSMP